MTAPAVTRRAALLGSAAMLAAPPGWAAVQPPSAKPVRRRILALYDGAIEQKLRLTNAHRLAAMPLEWLGLTIEYHDLRIGLPQIWGETPYRGVLTWFTEPNIADFAAYVGWIEKVTSAGLRLVQIGDVGAKPGSMPPDQEALLRRRLFAAFGVRAMGQWSTLTLGDTLSARAPGVTGFEIEFAAELPPYELYAPARPDAASWLVATRADKARSQSHLVIVSPAGGFIAPDYAVGIDPMTGVKQWHVDPFAFFAAAFDTDDVPVPDTTTVCGRRIFYSHIDGDGWRSISQIRTPGRAPLTNAETVLRAVIATNPDLPVTVAPIAAELDPGFAGDLRAIGAVRGLFKLDNVEAATHTYTHPFRWSFFQDYRPDAEARFKEAYANAASGRSTVVETTNEPTGTGNCCGPAARRADSPPRAFGGRPFDLAQEVTGSAALIDSYAAPAGKRVQLLQWPGDCSPFPAALRTVASAGLLNINGGDSRCDKEFPSVSAVAPIGFRQDGLIQIYASNSSEELYTDLWTNRFFGFRDLPETWDRTGAPRRLKPMNLYYHMYSGERQASLDALLDNIRALRQRGDYIGIAASRYASIAQGFFSAAVQEEAPGVWRVRDRGDLNTVRLSRGAERAVDFASSSGVVGERVVNGQLYVALDPSAAEIVIATRQRDDKPPARPLLVQSSWVIDSLSTGGTRFGFNARGFGPADMTWLVPHEGRWHVTAGPNSVDVTVQADRVLAFTLPDSANKPIAIGVQHLVG